MWVREYALDACSKMLQGKGIGSAYPFGRARVSGNGKPSPGERLSLWYLGSSGFWLEQWRDGMLHTNWYRGQTLGLRRSPQLRYVDT